MSKSVLITQSNYIPWKGYFDAINQADEFILYDEVQFTRRDWRNRNRVVSPGGVKWLTVPVQVKGKYHQKINETCVADEAWASKHWHTLENYYRNAPEFETFAEAVKKMYNLDGVVSLSLVNERLLRGICNVLEITTPFSRCENFTLCDGKNQRLINLCRQVNATRYLSGPAAAAYLDEEAFQNAGIEVKWLDYSGYPPYPQQLEVFDHHVSILDLLFNVGGEFRSFMKSFR